MTDSEEEGDKVQFKIVLLGDGAVGKTSITHRFTNDEFKQSYLQTIGVDWSMKTVILPGTLLDIDSFVICCRGFRNYLANLGYWRSAARKQNALQLCLWIRCYNIDLRYDELQ